MKPPTLTEARRKLVTEQGARVELQNRARRGELAPLADMAAIVTEMFATVRANLLALPAALAEPLAAATTPKAVEALLRDRIHGTLRELSVWRPPAPHRRSPRRPSRPGVTAPRRMATGRG
jgi:hypothetical protein